MQKLLRLPELLKFVPLTKQSIYLLVKAGQFPAPIKMGERSIAWVDDEVQAWLEQRKQNRII